MAEVVLEVEGLSKTFPGVRALHNVHFSLEAGEVHAILGENGAGKTTFMNILYGLVRPDTGRIRLWGKPYAPRSPAQAAASGIGMVHQHFMQIPALTVAENIALGAEPRRGLRLDLATVEQKIEELSSRFGLSVNPRARVEDLSVGLRQRVEILKAFYREARLLILDEPTALLTPQESRELFAAVRRFKEQGIPVIFISHKLAEVEEIADRISVLRRGEMVATLKAHEATPVELARLMVGREVALNLEPPPQEPGPPLLRVEELRAPQLGPLSFEILAGEILGVAGVEGNGQEPLIQALAGLIPSQGRIELAGKELHHLGVRARMEAGLRLIPSDRQEEGLVLRMSVADNFSLRDFYRPPLAQRGLLRVNLWLQRARELIDRFDVRPPEPRARAGALSGGNQQKVVLAREIAAQPKVLIASQPTRGLDVGATEFVHRELLELRRQGFGVLLVSLDLDEILTLSDRVLVLYRGQIAGLLKRAEAHREQIGLLMLGAERVEA